MAASRPSARSRLTHGQKMELAVGKSLSAENTVPRQVWLSLIVVCSAMGTAALAWGWLWIIVPLCLLAGLACLVQPAWGLYLVVVCMFLPYRFLPDSQAYPINVAISLVILGFWLQRVVAGKSGFSRTSLDVPFAIWLAIMALSLTKTYDVAWGVINLRYHIFLVLLFYVAVGSATLKLSKRLVWLLIAIASVIAAFNVAQFIASGGSERVFGLTRIYFSGLLTLTMVYLTARICFEPNNLRVSAIGALLVLAALGQIANQSRGAMAITILGMLVVMIAAWRWGSRRDQWLPRRRVIHLAFGGLGVAIIVVILAGPIFMHVYGRLLGYERAAVTLNYRFFLWRTAWHAYLQNPIIGIGLGQAQLWDNLLPNVHLDPVGRMTVGLTVHNSFLGYLAETGSVGIVALLWVFGRMLRSTSTLLRTHRADQIGHFVGLWGIVVIIIIRAFFEHDVFFSIAGAATVLFSGLAVRLGSETDRAPRTGGLEEKFPPATPQSQQS